MIHHTSGDLGDRGHRGRHRTADETAHACDKHENPEHAGEGEELEATGPRAVCLEQRRRIDRTFGSSATFSAGAMTDVPSQGFKAWVIMQRLESGFICHWVKGRFPGRWHERRVVGSLLATQAGGRSFGAGVVGHAGGS